MPILQIRRNGYPLDILLLWSCWSRWRCWWTVRLPGEFWRTLNITVLVKVTVVSWWTDPDPGVHLWKILLYPAACSSKNNRPYPSAHCVDNCILMNVAPVLDNPKCMPHDWTFELCNYLASPYPKNCVFTIIEHWYYVKQDPSTDSTIEQRQFLHNSYWRNIVNWY